MLKKTPNRKIAPTSGKKKNKKSASGHIPEIVAAEQDDRPNSVLECYREILDSQISDGHPDMSIRQTSVLLHIYMSENGETVRGLATKLKISKPAITRALDKLQITMGFIRRHPDPLDGRSVIVKITNRGRDYLAKIEKNFVIY